MFIANKVQRMTQRYREKEEIPVIEFVKQCETLLLKLLT